MRVAPPVVLTPEVRAQLESLKRSRTSEVRAQERASMILMAADGHKNDEIARTLGQDKGKVGRWRTRFAKEGIAGILKDKTRPGRIPPLSQEVSKLVVHLTVAERPEGSTHWSRATMAKAAGISEASVGRIWAAHGLKPHLTKGFKLSNDKNFAEKLDDIVGLYLSPPEHAIVLSCDEKSQIQALDRTQPGLPLKKGRAQTFTHDYKRNGTTSLFAALNAADGTVISTCMKRHRHQEWIKFLRLIENSTPEDKQLHIICDNYATHKHEKVRNWLKRHPRFHIHFTPTSASWLNMVERFFRDLTVNSVRRGVFKNVDELTRAIEEYIKVHNRDPKPFIWTATAKDILEKVVRGRTKLNNMQKV